jgi:hypothetical protein
MEKSPEIQSEEGMEDEHSEDISHRMSVHAQRIERARQRAQQNFDGRSRRRGGSEVVIQQIIQAVFD